MIHLSLLPSILSLYFCISFGFLILYNKLQKEKEKPHRSLKQVYYFTVSGQELGHRSTGSSAQSLARSKREVWQELCFHLWLSPAPCTFRLLAEFSSCGFSTEVSVFLLSAGSRSFSASRGCPLVLATRHSYNLQLTFQSQQEISLSNFKSNFF